MRLFLFSLFFCTTLAQAETKNIVLFFVDDMGWTDLGCTGSDLHETPHIDALAAEGTRFTNAYAACTVCSPSRAALFTGQNPARLRVTDFIPGHPFVNTPLTIPDWTKVLEKKHATIPELLKEHGYTSAHIGKWHLAHRDGYETGGADTPDTDYYPTAHGFDINVGGCEAGAPGSYFWPYGRGKDLATRKQNQIYETLPRSEKSEEELEGEYLTDRLAMEAETLLQKFADDDVPFFLNFAFYNVHTPLMGRPELVEKYEKLIAENPDRQHTNAKYAAMVESTDDAVGRVVAKLKETGAYDNTLIIFSSDNGGLDPSATDNAPLRQGKGSIYEGGTRVPTIIRAPGRGEAKSLSHVPVITMDFLPTIFDAIGKPLPAPVAAVQDGVSLLPLFDDPRDDLGREALYWHYPHYHSMGAQPYSAIRRGKWKLIDRHLDQGLELYDLTSDIHENSNLAAQRPEVATDLFEKLNAWREQIDAQMPTKNVAFDAGQLTGVKRGKNIRPAALTRE